MGETNLGPVSTKLDPGLVRVVNITGYPRSGTTIFSRLLGELPHFFCIGEAIFVWTRGLIDNDLCGCGRSFRDCPFWGAVGQRAFGGWDHVDAERLADASRTLYPAVSRLPVRHEARRQRQADIRHLALSLRRMLEAVHAESGAAWLVDSSKAYRYTRLLERLPQTRALPVHMVRDSRGVAHSAKKPTRRPEVVDRFELIPNYSTGRLALSWTVHNLLYGLQQAGAQGLRIRYEDFAKQPDVAQRRVLAALDSAPIDMGPDRSSPGTFDLGVTHTVSGNPNRFSTGTSIIREDRAWRQSLSRSDWLTATLITLPLLGRYGYLTQSGDALP